MFVAVIGLLLTGYPVAFALGGTALLFAFLGHLLGAFDFSLMQALPQRIYGVMTNEVLIAIPLFVFMGAMLERSKVAEDLLQALGRMFGRIPGGLGYSVTIVGALLAASTGVIGATAVTMGLIALPVMLRAGYDKRLACGSVAAAATLTQIIPPATVLVVLGDQLANAYQQAQLAEGVLAPETVTVGDLFAGALFPGLMLAGLYLLYQAAVAFVAPERSPPLAALAPLGLGEAVRALLAPLALIVAVLGSILGGIATPTEAAAVGAVGAMLLAFLRLAGRANRRDLWDVLLAALGTAVQITSMIFLILIGATLFSLVFWGFGGNDTVHRLLSSLPGGTFTAVAVVMAAIFVLGFHLEFLEIIFIVVPVAGPVLLRMEGVDPVWLGVMIAVNLQTSFLTPPVGATLFYLRGAAPPEIATGDIYRGAVPFVLLQLSGLLVLWFFPGLATWLPRLLYG
ncbi:MAG: TRAP transporter large permease subunit [Bradyrhizobiaceae bacterium]|nr:TRAP transporter large permease subunit [Bradyrhizobiaceae bacterium]